MFYELTKEKSDWASSDGEITMHADSCCHLARIYTTIAEQLEASGDLQKNLEFLQKAYNMAREGLPVQSLTKILGLKLGAIYSRS